MRATHLLILVLSLYGTAGSAQTFKNGIGIQLGDPTGISYKHHIDPTNAIGAAAAWSLDGKSRLQLQADYLFHNDRLIQVARGRLPLYYGIGGQVELREDNRDLWGVRIPLGIDYYFAGAPFDIFAEIVPVLQIIPSTDVDLEGSLGFRFWF